MDWFLYDNGLGHERVNPILKFHAQIWVINSNLWKLDQLHNRYIITQFLNASQTSLHCTKMKLSIKNFYCKRDQICKKSFMENFIFYPVLEVSPCGLNSFKYVKLQKQQPEMFYKNKYSWKFGKVQRKILVPESLF